MHNRGLKLLFRFNKSGRPLLFYDNLNVDKLFFYNSMTSHVP